MPIPCIDAEQFEFELFVKKRMGVPADIILSAEWCCCGRGIPLLYEFYLNKEGRSLDGQITGEEIFSAIETDPVARKTFNKFLVLLGALLNSNCTVLLPDSGVILCGNIIKNVIHHIVRDFSDRASSHFFKGFYANSSNLGYVEQIPIYFTSEADLSLKGCLVRVKSRSTTS
jgi:glucokinase